MKTRLLVSVMLIVLGFVTLANGQVGITVGNDYGIGLIAQVGVPAVKLEVGGGVAPLLIYWQVDDMFGSDDNYLKFYFPGALGAKLSIGLNDPDEKGHIRLKLGGGYNTIMKAGFGGGMDLTIDDEPTAVVLTAGLMIYPEAGDELLDRLNDEENTSYTQDDVSAALMSVQPFVGISFFF